jgi:putative hemolysin
MLTKSLIIVVLLILSSFFSGAETAFMSLGKFKYKEYIRRKKKHYLLVQKLKENPRKLLSTILIGNNLVNIAIASLATLFSAEYLVKKGLDWNHAIIASIITGTITLVVLIFGEIMPKTWANLNYERYIRFSARPIYLLSLLFTPLIFLLDFVTKLASSGHKIDDKITEEEIKTIVNVGSEEGGIDFYEKHLIHKIFQFDDKIVREIMTPKTKVYSINSNLRIKDVLKGLLNEGYSRVPIYGKDPNDIVGIFHIRDVLSHLEKNKIYDPVKSISFKPFFILGSKPIDNLFKEMQRRKVQLAVVVDKKGKMEGIVTMEDLLEEIVGEMYDEDEQQTRLIRKVGKKEYLLEGEVSLREIKEKTSVKIDGLESETISSWIISRYKRFPKIGSELKLRRGKLIILDVKDKLINSVKLQL